MCRLIAFTGACTRCRETFTWDDLSQELSCLEAKNTGVFGQCKRGVQTDQHSFDQECDACAEIDEGYGDMEEEEYTYTSGGTDKKSSVAEGKKAAAHFDDEDGRRSKKQRTS
ncbi:hypothetical protein B0H66DRAFT_539015 [Apodospora peruviana]|uniref:Uncharacterized protein n=1 Tax=Apodospora peruviana TaxID=516989 RepID=A0AAE0LY46_9PEZI|nr:hypothetical protein B0H66DRAFT_539015 [Apodospora peruviana]